VRTFPQKIGYILTAFLGRVIFTVIARVKIVYFHRPPKEEPFLLVPNHISHFDPPLLGAFFPRYTDWLSMEELFTKKWSAAFFHMLGCIPIDRFGEDRTALRAALKRLKAGHVIGIFPEGGLRDGANSVLAGGPFRPGFALLATHAGVPVVPAVIIGSDRIYNCRNLWPWRRSPVWVGLGAPIAPRQDLPRDAAREQLSADLAAAWTRIKDDLCARFSLGEDDMPHSPQQRMKEK